MQIHNSFSDFNIHANILTAVKELGYETPSAVQSGCLTVLLEGNDLQAQAQTGTGKTAAFALPIVNNIDVKENYVQALVLAPTRELAIQVAQAFVRYSKYVENFRVLPIYGGQDFRPQLKALERGVHVVVGTPGRVMDHLRRGTLVLDKLKTIVLDEADEMLAMGFVEDIEWILEKIPTKHQTALFSATMSRQIQNIAKKYLNNPAKVHIEPSKTTVDTITQQFTLLSNRNKLEALTRFLEVEEYDAVLIFTRTKLGSDQLAGQLQALGHATASLNGDMNQGSREKVIANLKSGRLDIVVATDVAARGLDVKRISHVFNFDIPQDVDSYIHRIGRTGRAGRSGKAFLFVTPNERRMLSEIERAIGAKINSVDPPSASQVNIKRSKDLSNKILTVLEKVDLNSYREQVASFVHDNEFSELDMAAALSYLLDKKKPLTTADDAKLVEVDRGSSRPDSRNKRRFGGGGGGGDRRSSRPNGDRNSDRRSSRPSGDRDSERRSSRPSGDRDSERRSSRPSGDRDSDRRSSRPSGDRDSDRRSSRPTGDRDGERRSSRPNGDRDGERRSSRPSGDRDRDRKSRPGDEKSRDSKRFSDRGPKDNKSSNDFKPKKTFLKKKKAKTV